jgi:nucleoside-diphosphate-sugar epimerase
MSTQYQEANKPRILIIGSAGRIGSRVIAEIAKIDAVEAVYSSRTLKQVALGTRTARMLCSLTSTGLKPSGRHLPE